MSDRLSPSARVSSSPDIASTFEGTRVRTLAVSFLFSAALVVTYALSSVYVESPTVQWLLFSIMLAGIGLAGGLGLLVVRPLIHGREQALKEAYVEMQQVLRRADQQVEQIEAYAHEVEQANEDLRRFATVASHDLKEPVRMISSYIALLKKRYGETMDEDAQEYMDYAIEGAHRLHELINGLNTYARVGNTELDFETVALDAVFDAATQNLKQSIDGSDARIHTGELPEVHGNRAQLTQLFQNLISNAIKYSGDEPPEIHVWAEKVDDQWLVAVRDHGIGFDSDREHRIFDIFQRAHDDAEGQGVGLAVCKRIVNRHRGEIWAEARPGEGATFKVTLPAAPSELGPMDGPAAPPRTLEERTEEVI